MPTGFTECLLEDEPVSFKDFLLGCAQASQYYRDRSWDRKSPDTSYNQEQLDKAKAKLVSLVDITDLQLWQDEHDRVVRIVKQHDQEVERGKKLKEKLTGLIDQIKEWNSPSPEHDWLKIFMLEQVELTLKHDGHVCGDDCYNRFVLNPPKAETDASKLRLNRMTDCIEDINYHEKAIRDERLYTESAKNWIKTLRESV